VRKPQASHLVFDAFEAQARERCEGKAEQQAEEQRDAAAEVGIFGGRVGELDQQDENEVYEVSEHKKIRVPGVKGSRFRGSGEPRKRAHSPLLAAG